MSQNIAFLTRLRQIAEESPPCDRCPPGAVSLFNIYLGRLYAQLDIGQSNRPTMRAKAQADSTLAALRIDVLRTEVAASNASAAVFAAIRYQIEMARRVLAIRITSDEDSPDALSDGRAAGLSATLVAFDVRLRARRDQSQSNDAVQRKLRGRRLVVQSLDAIRRSRGVLSGR